MMKTINRHQQKHKTCLVIKKKPHIKIFRNSYNKYQRVAVSVTFENTHYQRTQSLCCYFYLLQNTFSQNKSS